VLFVAYDVTPIAMWTSSPWRSAWGLGVRGGIG
jgi:hypothetical protein